MQRNVSRRWFLGGLIAAPAIVSIANIMPIKSLITPVNLEWEILVQEWQKKGFDRYNFVSPSNFQPTTPQKFQEGVFKSLVENAQLRPDYDLQDDLRAAFKEHGL